MAVALLLTRLLLSAVFLIAGIAKLADLPGSQKALHDFGIPEALAKPLGIILPIAEIATAGMLLSVRWPLYGAIGALGLLLVFIAGIGYNLARGRRPNCHCFGQLHSAPVGPSTLIRNALLALLAALVVWLGRGHTSLSATSWFTALPRTLQITLIVGIIVLALVAGAARLFLHALSQQGRLLLRLERLESRLAQAGMVFGMPLEQEQASTGLPVGTQAPAFTGKGLDQEKISLNALRALGKPVLLIFTTPTCGPCSELMPEIGRWQHDYANLLTVALLSRGPVEDNRVKVTEQNLTRLLLQEHNEIDELYSVTGTPSAVLIHPDGLIESPLAVGPKNIQALVEKAVSLRQPPLMPLIVLGNQSHRTRPEPAASRIGTPAPAFNLPNLNGESVSLRSFLGQATLVLFWNPDCGFCKSMLPDVKAWVEKPLLGAPKLLIISRGTAEENHAIGSHAPVLLDEEGIVSKLFGANGTPVAVLVDALGRIASTPVEGAADVLALAGSARATLTLSLT